MLDRKPSCNYQKCLDVIKLLVATSILQHDGQHSTVYTTDGEDTKNHWDVQVLNHRWLEGDSDCLWPQLRIWNVRWIITYFAPSVDGNVTKKEVLETYLIVVLVVILFFLEKYMTCPSVNRKDWYLRLRGNFLFPLGFFFRNFSFLLMKDGNSLLWGFWLVTRGSSGLFSR